MNINKFILLVVFSLLTACGGGEGGSNNGDGGNNNEIPNTGNSSFSGTAATGIIKEAEVKAYIYNLSNRTKGKLLSSTTTDKDNGSYSLNFDTDKDITILVELKGINGQSKVTCDSASGCFYNNKRYKFGADYDIDDNFTLTSITEYKSGVASQVHLTPLTHIITQLVESSTKSISQSNTQIAQLFHLSTDTLLTDIKPIDITKNNMETSNISKKSLKTMLIISSFEEKGRNVEKSMNNLISKLKNNEVTKESVKKILIKSILSAKAIKQKNNRLAQTLNELIDDIKVIPAISETLNTTTTLMPPIIPIQNLSLPE